MKVRFIPASDTRENWLAKNPVALPGEICVEIDTGRWKFGDGSRPYSELPYAKQDFTQEDLPAPVDLSEYPTRFEVQMAVQSVADPVIVLTEAEFAAIVPDATKIYVIY